MAFTYDLGRLRFFHRGAYSPTTQYELNDVVSYGGQSYVYVNLVKASGNLPTLTSHWALLAGGQAFRGTWTTSTAYLPNDIVTHGGTSYIALLAHTAGTFETDLNANKWNEFVEGQRWRGTWAEGTAYLKGDLFTDAVSTYIVLDDYVGSASVATDVNDGHAAVFAAGADYLPAQAGQNGKVLSTDGSDPLWVDDLTLDTVTVDELTIQTNPMKAGNGAPTLSANLTNPIATFVTNTDTTYSDPSVQGSFAQFAIQNQANVGTAASTDMIVIADVGSDTDGWIDMGITGTAFDDATYGITGPHDGYIFMVAPEGTTGAGNLVLATGNTGTENKIVFAAGGLVSGTEQMIIVPNDFVHIEIPTPSTSPTTGAFRVVGGVGISGNLNVLGNTSIQGTITIGGGAFQSDNLTVSDPLIFSGADNNADTFDLGYLGEYSDDIVDIPATITARSRTANTAVITTAAAHNYLVGDTVTIAGVGSGFDATNVRITGIDSVVKFTYANTGSTVAEGSGSGTANVTRRRKFFGMVRDADTDHIRLFENLVTKPTTTVDFTQTSDMAIRMGAITAPSLNRVANRAALNGDPYSSYPTGSTAYVVDEGRYYTKGAAGWDKAVTGDQSDIVLGSRIFG